jgi:hypothetical protein
MDPNLTTGEVLAIAMPSIRRMAEHFAQGEADLADDLTQEGLIYVWRRFREQPRTKAQIVSLACSAMRTARRRELSRRHSPLDEAA